MARYILTALALWLAIVALAPSGDSARQELILVGAID